MPSFDASSISSVAIHHVGNKTTGEGLILSQRAILPDDALQNILATFLLSSFKGEEYYQLFDEQSLDANPIFPIARRLFDNPALLHEESCAIARLLFDATAHPNIKPGDLFVVYFKDCQLGGETLDAIGIFKSENREAFLRINRDDESWSRLQDDPTASADFSVDILHGISTSKLDKGALIFNSDADQGFILSVVDNTNRGADAIYWKDDFLHVRQRQDAFFNTHQAMQLYKEFVSKELPQQFEVSKADQADLLNKSVQFFKQNDNFEIDDFERDVLQQPEVIDSFRQYRDDFSKRNDLQLPDSFGISDGAVKQQSRSYKSVIKLDKNFHIYVHGDRKLIEQGEDEKGKFYKVYYEEES